MAKWTDEAPKKRGWYWFADALTPNEGDRPFYFSGHPEVFRVWEGIGGQMYCNVMHLGASAEKNDTAWEVEEMNGWWAGPLRMPSGLPDELLPKPFTGIPTPLMLIDRKVTIDTP